MNHNKTMFQQRRTLLATGGALALACCLPGTARAAGAPIRVGATLPLTGPLAAVGGIHKIAAEVYIELLNRRGGLLGRKVELVLLDDQSQPANARTLYERLVTSEKVDLLMGPYGTGAIIAAMGVAQRFGKLFIQSSLGDPALAPYAHRRHRSTAGRVCQHAGAAQDHCVCHQQIPVGAGPGQGRPGSGGAARPENHPDPGI
jgi:branched-chain amino acid transport system substrate-binding protein